jgi:hypothetical protein
VYFIGVAGYIRYDSLLETRGNLISSTPQCLLAIASKRHRTRTWHYHSSQSSENNVKLLVANNDTDRTGRVTFRHRRHTAKARHALRLEVRTVSKNQRFMRTLTDSTPRLPVDGFYVRRVTKPTGNAKCMSSTEAASGCGNP